MPLLLTTDLIIWLLVGAGLVYGLWVRGRPSLRQSWGLVFGRPLGLASALVVAFFLTFALLDSIHFRLTLPSAPASEGAVSQAPAGRAFGEPQSLLDLMLRPLVDARERSYSAPLARSGFRKESLERGGVTLRDYPPLRFGGAHLAPNQSHLDDLLARSAEALAVGLGLLAILVLIGRRWARRRPQFPLRTAFWVMAVLVLATSWVVGLSSGYHVFGTDRTGQSVLVLALKSLRTALVLGSLTTLVVLPLAVGLGVLAGSLRGWIDEVIQYLYTLLASIPDVLLIAASVLLLQAFIDANPSLFQSALERSDARLLFLCLILGITSFTGLCRLVRAEALKLRELEYIQAARSFGVSMPSILFRHITPNLMHIVLIHAVMQFSSFVLAEAVLSYVGIGVDPNTASFGLLINAARAELAASPIVWWSLATAFVFMLLLVLSANLLADAVRDAFDPRTRLSSRPAEGGELQ